MVALRCLSHTTREFLDTILKLKGRHEEVHLFNMTSGVDFSTHVALVSCHMCWWRWAFESWKDFPFREGEFASQLRPLPQSRMEVVEVRLPHSVLVTKQPATFCSWRLCGYSRRWPQTHRLRTLDATDLNRATLLERQYAEVKRSLQAAPSWK